MKRRLLSVLMALCMLASMFPVSAFADEAGLAVFAEETVDGAAALDAFAREEAPTDLPTDPPHEHAWVPAVIAPTCTAQGYTVYTCACGDSYIADYTDALNHPQVIDIAEIPASCTTDGVTAGKQCLLCGQIVEGCQPIPATGHVPMDVAEVPATEFSAGTTAGTMCAVCGAVLSGCEVIPMLQIAYVAEQPASAEEQSVRDQPPVQNTEEPDLAEAPASQELIADSSETTAGVSAVDGNSENPDAASPDASDGDNSTEADVPGQAEPEEGNTPEDDSEIVLTAENTMRVFRPETDEIELTNEQMLDGFMAEALYGEVPPDGMGPGYAKKNFGAGLTGNDARAYRALKPLVTEVANGTRTSTVFSFPAKTILGSTTAPLSMVNNGDYFDLSLVHVTLCRDCPYEMYWHDFEDQGIIIWLDGTVRQTGSSVDMSKVTFYFGLGVMREYRDGTTTSANGMVIYSGVSKATATRVKTAVSNAKAIVNQASGLEDWDKLFYYGNTICDLVEYDFDFLDSSYVANAHQLIYTFDGDPNTNIVCEGYAKSFQYLCDLTDFQRNIACYCLSGDGDGAGPHMWNAVTMDNGANYLADVTWTDQGLGLFLVTADSGDPNSRYYFTDYNNQTQVYYEYDEPTLNSIPLKARTITLNKPYVPSPILKTVTNVLGGVKVVWEQLPDISVDLYYVYRKDGDSTNWTKIASTTGNSWLDNTVKAKTKYTYLVRAVISGTASGYNTTKAVVYYPAPVPGIPTSVVGGVKFTWQAAAGAAKYRVFRKGPGQSSWVKLVDVSGTSYLDKTVKSGNEYIYTVRSLNSSGSIIGGYASGGESIYYIAAPALPSVANSAAGVKVTWTAVNGAEKYRVLRKGPNDSSWKGLINTASTSYVDKSVVSNTTYKYTIRCVTGDGTTLTSGYDATGKAVKYIAAPTVSSVAAMNGGIQIKWNKPAGAVKFRVLRKVGSGSWASLAVTTAQNYTDKNVKIGTTYSYTVRCISSDGKSNTSAYNTTGKTLRYAATPKAPTLVLHTSGIKVSWAAATGAVNYRVYRKAVGDSTWSKVVDTTALSYIDQTVQSNTEYIYSIRCVTSDGKFVASALGAASKTVKFVQAPEIWCSHNPKSGGIRLWWVQSADQYRVFRKGPYDSGWVKLADTTRMEYTDNTAEYMTVYQYAVRCLSKDGKTYTSGLGPAKSHAILPTPVLNITDVGNGVHISCNSVYGATTYSLSRTLWFPDSPDNREPEEHLYTGSYPADYYDYDVAPGETYLYRITCTSESLDESGRCAYSFNTATWTREN